MRKIKKRQKTKIERQSFKLVIHFLLISYPSLPLFLNPALTVTILASHSLFFKSRSLSLCCRILSLTNFSSHMNELSPGFFCPRSRSCSQLTAPPLFC